MLFQFLLRVGREVDRILTNIYSFLLSFISRRRPNHLKDPESLGESESESSGKDRLREELLQRQEQQLLGAFEYEQPAPILTDSDRRDAVDKLLTFLHEEDKEDSEERARARGESLTDHGPYVVREQVPIPVPEEDKYETEVKVTETVEHSANGVKHTITQETKTTFLPGESLS